jgi:manganese-transporting P-type ATPase
VIPAPHRGTGDIVPIHKKNPSDPKSYTFSYQRDTYIMKSESPVVFTALPYPSSSNPPLISYHSPKGLISKAIPDLKSLYGKNEFNIPIPSFSSLFAEHATAPFFVFQVFCVALWCLDEYWYYSLFTLFMLIVFECTVVWQVSCAEYKVHVDSDGSIACSYSDRIQNYVNSSIPYSMQEG